MAKARGESSASVSYLVASFSPDPGLGVRQIAVRFRLDHVVPSASVGAIEKEVLSPSPTVRAALKVSPRVLDAPLFVCATATTSSEAAPHPFPRSPPAELQ